MTSGGAPRWARFVPGIYVATHYDRTWLRGDLIAGVTVAAYLIPQVMAYAEIAGLPAVYGLWGILVPLAIYAIVGSSRLLSPGPESTLALMTSVGVGALVSSVGSARYAEVASLLAISVGLICLLAAVGRLGYLANLLSRPILLGYLVGIAILMIASQLGKITRLTVVGETPWEEVSSVFGQLSAIHWPSLAMATVVFLSLLAFRRWLPRWPGPLIAMLSAAGVVALLHLDQDGFRVVGSVAQGLPVPRLPNLGDLSVWTLLPYALSIAVVGFSDNVLTARAFAAKRREPVDSAQELLAMGLMNLVTGLFQGFPVSSSSSRTALAEATGARTQLHSLVGLMLVVVTLLFLGPVLSTFPTAALGAVVMYAAVRLIEIGELRRVAKFRRSEIVLAILTTVAVIVLGVLPGIGLAVGLSILDLIRRIAHPDAGVLGYVPGLAGMHDVRDYPKATLVPGLVIFRYDSPLFFANAEDFISRAVEAVDRCNPPCEWFVLNAEANIQVDVTSVDTLDLLRETLAGRGIIFAMARVKQEIREQLREAGFVAKVGEQLIYPTLPTAVAGYVRWYWERHGEFPRGVPDSVVPHPDQPVE